MIKTRVDTHTELLVQVEIQICHSAESERKTCVDTHNVLVVHRCRQRYNCVTRREMRKPRVDTHTEVLVQVQVQLCHSA